MMKLLLLLLLVFIAPAFAAKKTFNVMLKTKYDKNWFKITQEGSKWICETKHVPYYEAPANPLSSVDWPSLEKESASRPKKCAELVGFQNGMTGKEKTLVTCLSQESTQKAYRTITELCRAGI